MKFKQQLRIVNQKRPSLARYAQNIKPGDIITLETQVDVWGELSEDKLLRINIYRDGEYIGDLLQYEVKFFKEIFEFKELL